MIDNSKCYKNTREAKAEAYANLRLQKPFQNLSYFANENSTCWLCTYQIIEDENQIGADVHVTFPIPANAALQRWGISQ